MAKRAFPSSARFLISLPRWRPTPEIDLPVVVVAGRSNVGKSSFINLLLRRRSLARTSSTPGRTQLLNFFAAGEKLILADVPGYGWAKAPPGEVRAWSEAVRGFVRDAGCIRAVILLLDIRRIPSPEDLAFARLVREYGRELIPVLTKADKLSRAEGGRQLARIAAALGVAPGALLSTSANTQEGRDAVWDRIFSLLDKPEAPSPRKLSVVAVDGPSGAGKSTISRAVAARLGWNYLDTGAMYRAVGLKADRLGVALEDDPALAAMLEKTSVSFSADGRVLLDGQDVSLAIREHRVSALASRVSARRPVREAMAAFQRAEGEARPTVAEGRDMGTVVFPDARLKVYLTADPAERARRRTAELAERGEAADYEKILADIQARDAADSGRELAPLAAAPDAREVDTTGLTVDQVVDAVAALLEAAPA